jgi:hypothetical protein
MRVNGASGVSGGSGAPDSSDRHAITTNSHVVRIPRA